MKFQIVIIDYRLNSGVFSKMENCGLQEEILQTALDPSNKTFRWPKLPRQNLQISNSNQQTKPPYSREVYSSVW